MRAWTDERLAVSAGIGREYLEGRGAFPERLPWLLLTGRLLDEHVLAVRRWAEWAARARGDLARGREPRRPKPGHRSRDGATPRARAGPARGRLIQERRLAVLLEAPLVARNRPFTDRAPPSGAAPRAHGTAVRSAPSVRPSHRSRGGLDVHRCTWCARGARPSQPARPDLRPDAGVGRLHRAAAAVPRLRVPGHRRLPELVPALRRDVQLGPRLHEHQGRRQHQHRARLRPPAVRHHLPPGLDVQPLLDRQARPPRAQARRGRTTPGRGS